MAFEFKAGEVTRIAPAMLHESLAEAAFHTGDAPLDELLEAARHKFLNRSLDVRHESLEKLWDSWERLKTIEVAGDKKASVKALLDKVTTEPVLRAKIEDEARELTDIGNMFMIRHTETGKIPIVESAQVDYFFHRMFAMIRLLLRGNAGRAPPMSRAKSDRNRRTVFRGRSAENRKQAKQSGREPRMLLSVPRSVRKELEAINRAHTPIGRRGGPNSKGVPSTPASSDHRRVDVLRRYRDEIHAQIDANTALTPEAIEKQYPGSCASLGEDYAVALRPRLFRFFTCSRSVNMSES